MEWWPYTAMALVVVVQAVVLWVFLRAAAALSHAMAALSRALADATARDAEVIAAYNRLLLHSERRYDS